MSQKMLDSIMETLSNVPIHMCQKKLELKCGRCQQYSSGVCCYSQAQRLFWNSWNSWFEESNEEKNLQNNAFVAPDKQSSIQQLLQWDDKIKMSVEMSLCKMLGEMSYPSQYHVIKPGNGLSAHCPFHPCSKEYVSFMEDSDSGCFRCSSCQTMLTPLQFHFVYFLSNELKFKPLHCPDYIIRPPSKTSTSEKKDKKSKKYGSNNEQELKSKENKTKSTTTTEKQPVRSRKQQKKDETSNENGTKKKRGHKKKSSKKSEKGDESENDENNMEENEENTSHSKNKKCKKSRSKKSKLELENNAPSKEEFEELKEQIDKQNETIQTLHRNALKTQKQLVKLQQQIHFLSDKESASQQLVMPLYNDQNDQIQQQLEPVQNNQIQQQQQQGTKRKLEEKSKENEEESLAKKQNRRSNR